MLHTGRHKKAAKHFTPLFLHPPRSFTCTTFWPEYLIAGVAQECGGQYNTSVGLCLDGLNERGLAVASLGVFAPVDAPYSELGGRSTGCSWRRGVHYSYCIAML